MFTQEEQNGSEFLVQQISTYVMWFLIGETRGCIIQVSRTYTFPQRTLLPIVQRMSFSTRPVKFAVSPVS